MNNIDIGKRLIELRGNRTQDQVARDNGISLSAIGMYERGERIPRDEIKIRLANYYGRTVQDIFFA
ncbi:MAG: helix-turn-helix transcriptional regulator [Clostridia bacterium]|nr:helix-turn-helix transcriptional regulator [Clostridia bacterium]